MVRRINRSTEEDNGEAGLQEEKSTKYAKGTNFVEGGADENPFIFFLCIAGPLMCQLFAYLTSEEMHKQVPDPYVTTLVPACVADLKQCALTTLNAAMSVWPTVSAVKFVASFMGVALLLEMLPGKVETGPETQTGHVPKYVDNGVKHCLVYTALFVAGSNFGFNLYDFGIMFDVFPPALATLNIFGMLLGIFLTIKGLTFPSTGDCGSTGSLLRDLLWGTELYPRVFGFDIKRFINCRFSMTFWQLAGLSFAYRSYTIHGELDWGLILSAVSQYLYLFKFFWWEMGYMRSIDIIVDRAGFTIQWGCLAYVPAVYTLHTRYLVLHPSGMSIPVASLIFVISLAGVVLNYAADRERDVFRATNGKALVWGKKPQFITAQYTVEDTKTGEKTQRTSLLLASGFWGVARHFQYLFELTAAWSWCMLSNPLRNGMLPLYYAAFLTYLLVDRANRDSLKCHKKYGKYYEEYCRLVPYKILPGVY
jgi:7-dehydrocholesterol reductase